MISDNRLYNLAISFLPGIGNINARKLISRFGDAEKLFNAPIGDIKKTSGIGDIAALKLYNGFPVALQLAQEELEYTYLNDVEFVSFLEDEYPKRLLECDDSPVVLYYKGKPDFNAHRIISIVGTRNATKYGTDFCDRIVGQIAEKYPETIIVSGLAYGIDVAAHKAALNYGLKTWAVFGHNLKTVYPAVHKRVANKIIDQGGVVISDYPHNSITDPSNFVKRNRIVAGIADLLIIVESALKGGSIVTANVANHYNRDVFAVPGSINSKYSAGPNRLIKTNRANLLESLEDIEYIMNWSSENKMTKINMLELIDNLTENELKIVDVLKKYEFLDIDNISRQSGLETDILSLCLLELEFKKLVRALPGKLFSLKTK
ncbi:MAG: DNA-processing protein DprA [Bacteroidales bacterium]|nr:DNA-processing protein DprA [Bacteroidales bacterium]